MSYEKINEDSRFKAEGRGRYCCLLTPFIFLFLFLSPLKAAAQELQVKVNINSSNSG